MPSRGKERVRRKTRPPEAPAARKRRESIGRLPNEAEPERDVATPSSQLDRGIRSAAGGFVSEKAERRETEIGSAREGNGEKKRRAFSAAGAAALRRAPGRDSGIPDLGSKFASFSRPRSRVDDVSRRHVTGRTSCLSNISRLGSSLFSFCFVFRRLSGASTVCSWEVVVVKGQFVKGTSLAEPGLSERHR